jgi:tripartite-type tricarboxylate transporter receptor subunit TctC
MRKQIALQVTFAAALLLLPAVPAAAQSVEQFYRGRTIDMIVGYPAGGSNDVYARAVAHHIGKHLPGRPTTVMRNMPGGGSIVAANHIYNVAPKDGSVLGILAATNALDEKLGAPGVKFETAKFTWVGRLASGTNVTFTMKDGPVTTFDQALQREATLGATGTGSTVYVYPNVLNRVLGTKFKLVMGYNGSVEVMLAMERGEVDGLSTSWDAVKSSRPDWIKDKRINYIVQYGLTRHPDLPDVPTCVELAKTPEQKQILGLVVNATEIGKSILSSPGIPAERVEALRSAFTAMTKDPEFVHELESSRLELTAMTGAELQHVVEQVGAMTPDMIAKVKAVYGTGG